MSNLLAGGGAAPYPVLGGEQRHEFQSIVGGDEVDGRRPHPVDAGVDRDQADARSTNPRGHVGEEHFDARPHGSARRSNLLGG
jgi:hypothetical protein